VEALQILLSDKVDLVILDLMLPDRDGFQVLSRIRRDGSQVPVLMLTCMGNEDDRCRAFALGADDFLVKPFSVLELCARTRALLRRAARGPEEAKVFHLGPFTFNSHRRQVYHRETCLHLTLHEYKLAELLARNSGVPLSRRELLTQVWGSEDKGSPKTLAVHIANLRKKLTGHAPTASITTVGSVGNLGYAWEMTGGEA
jgi:DNA-binding response OmpR family regulator